MIVRMALGFYDEASDWIYYFTVPFVGDPAV